MTPAVRALLLLLVFGLAGCSSFLDLFSKKVDPAPPAALVQFTPSAQAGLLWQANAGSAADFVFTPAVVGTAVYVAAYDGQLAKFSADNGRLIWRVGVEQKLSSGVGADSSIAVVATAKGEVLAYSDAGTKLWQAQVSSEVLGPVAVSDGVVVVRTADSRVFGLDAKDGKRLWLYQRSAPSLILRGFGGVAAGRGAAFVGFPGGKLVALNITNGAVGWEASIGLPRGASDLERIADVSSTPVFDSRYVYAVAYQGRVAAIDLSSGSLAWARDISSDAGLTVDDRNVYVSDARGRVHALDKSSGASVWLQDKLLNRRLSAPQELGRWVAVGDLQGYVHWLSKEDGSFAARLPTDGSSIRAKPQNLPTGLLLQTRSGGLYAAGI